MSFVEMFNPGARHTREQQDVDKVRSLERGQSAPPNGSGMVDFDANTLHIVIPEPPEPPEDDSSLSQE